MNKQIMELFNYSGVKAGKEHAIMQALLAHLKTQPELQDRVNMTSDGEVYVPIKDIIAMLTRELGTKEADEQQP